METLKLFFKIIYKNWSTVIRNVEINSAENCITFSASFLPISILEYTMHEFLADYDKYFDLNYDFGRFTLKIKSNINNNSLDNLATILKLKGFL